MSNNPGVPHSYQTLQPYLIFDGCAEAMAFYQQVFGAKERLRMVGAGELIGHAELQIGDSVLMMADQSPQGSTHAPAHFGGSPISLMIYVEDCDYVYRRALNAGATSLREPADQPYGARMGGVRDPFGYSWWIGTHMTDMLKEELEQLTESSPE